MEIRFFCFGRIINCVNLEIDKKISWLTEMVTIAKLTIKHTLC